MSLLSFLLSLLLLIMFTEVHGLGENNSCIIQAAFFTPTYEI